MKLSTKKAISKIAKFTPHSCFDHAWLGLGDISSLALKNPLMNRDQSDLDHPGLSELRLMRNPDYLSFAVKYLLNVELLPIQALILKELWIRPFPMLIASRGFSKCISKNTWIQTQNGFSRVQDVLDDTMPTNTEYYFNQDLYLYGEYGYKKVAYGWKNQSEECLKIRTQQNFSLLGTKDHPIRAVENGTIVWKQLQDLKIGNYIPINRSTEWPTCTNDLPEDVAYLFGCLVGDGGYTVRGSISFTTKDSEIVDRLNLVTKRLWGKTFNKVKDKYGYLICGHYIWDELFQKYGFNSAVCGEKDFPSCILNAPKASVAAFISGLMDTDGHCRKKASVVVYSAKSPKIVDTMQFILTRFGIISRRYKYWNKTYQRYYYHLTMCGEHVNIFHKEIGFKLNYKQDALIKHLSVNNNTNLDILPHELVLKDLLTLRQKCFDDNFSGRNDIKWHAFYLKKYQLSYKKLKNILALTIQYKDCQSWKNLQSVVEDNYFYDKVTVLSHRTEETFDFHIPDGHSFITNGLISHNTYSTAILSLLRCVLVPRTKIVIAGAAFRQSKFVFEYMETIWNNAPVLRSICSSSSGPRRGTDQWVMYINDSTATSIPIGNGEKIRGLRANTLVMDEFGCLRSDTLVQTDIGILEIKDFLNGEAQSLLKKDNEFEYPDKIFRTPKTDVYKITTQNGYSFSCSNIHQILTIDGWKIAKDLTCDDFVELDHNDYFPSEYIQQDNIIVNEAYGWLLGLLISEGAVTSKHYINITTTDTDLKDRIVNRLDDMSWKIYTKKAHQNKRGWSCKKVFDIRHNNTKLRQNLFCLGLDYVRCHDKIIPWAILRSPRSVVVEFLRGLFEGDGSGFKYNADDKELFGISYYSVSEKLIDVLQILLLKFGITCTKVKRKSKLSNNTQWMLAFRYNNAKKICDLLQIPKWINLANDIVFKDHKPTIFKRGKRFVVKTSRANRNIYLGTYDTEEECLAVFNRYWHNKRSCFRVRSVVKLPEQEVLYDFHLPTTHSFYGNGFVQHNSISPEIYETVLAGFTAVSADPISNVKEAARRGAMSSAGVWTDQQESAYLGKTGNQIILSGTASYDFEHFADYWRKYKSIIHSKGDKHKLEEILGGEIPSSFNWQDYSVVRIPYELVPEGFMDDRQIVRARATMHSGTYGREYGAVFVKDSNGFFKRTLIESCVANDKNIQNEHWPPWCSSKFEAVLRGKSNRQYVYGIDPASEVDRFSIIVLELWPEHARVVYGWSTTKKEFRDRLNSGLVAEHDFYGYCARKIRDLMTVFPCTTIGIDGQGGGIAVEEALHDPDKLKEGEIVLWPEIDRDKPKDTDHYPGVHILQMCQFADAKWTADANHGLRKDLEDKVLLFPFFDSVSLGLAAETDKRKHDSFTKQHPDKVWNVYDSLENCVLEVEELKDELSTIVQTRAGVGVGGRDRWSTPEVKTATGKKGYLRKDRYSALVMANMIARQISRTVPPIEYDVVGGASHTIGKAEGRMYHGPEWFVQNMYDMPVRSIQHSNREEG